MLHFILCQCSRSAMTSKTMAKMGGFLWTVFALFLILQPSAETRKTVAEEEEHTSRTRHHKASSLQMNIKRQQKQLTKTLQHFLEEYKNLYKMAEHLKNGIDPDESTADHYEDESHDMSRNNEHHSNGMKENPSRHFKHASTTPEHGEHHHQRMIRGSEETHKEDHVIPYENSDGDEELGHSGEGEHSGEHGEKHESKKEIDKKAHETGDHGDSHRVKKETKEINEIEQLEKGAHKRGNNGDRSAEKNHEEDHVTRSENSDGENDGDEQLGHSGEGEHSGEHEGEIKEGVHSKHDKRHDKSDGSHRENKETEEMHEIEQMEKEVHRRGNHGDSHRDKKETEEMHEIEQMEKEVHRRGNHGDSHRDKKETEEMHEIEQMEKEVHRRGNHGDSHRDKKETEEMHEIEQMEKEVHRRGNHGDSHRDKKETEEMHEIEQMEKEVHRRGNHGDSHRDKKETEEMHEIEQMEKEAHRRGKHGDSHRDKKETEEMHEIEQMEKETHNDNHGGIKVPATDSYTYGRTRRVSRGHDDDVDLQHGTEGHQRSSHGRKKHHISTNGDELHRESKGQAKVTHHMSAREDGNSNGDSVHRSSHGRTESSRHHTRGHHAGHVDGSSHKRGSRHALDHGHSSGHDNRLHSNLKDDTHHENTYIGSHQMKINKQHMDTRNDDDEDMYHGSKGHVKTSVHQQSQHHHLNKERENHHNPHPHHRTRRQAPSYDDDIFIDEINDEKKELYTAIFTSDDEKHHDEGGAPVSKLQRPDRNWMEQDSQSAPDCGGIDDQTFVYDKDNCRLCQCIKGHAKCEAKPRSCRDKLDNMCSFINGEMVVEGTPHYDGCNYCVCRKRQWVCTRLRCYFAQHDYVNYAALTKLTSGIERHTDTCMECDREPVTPVCGPDWRTYRSLCHARFCGNYDVDEIIQGPCSRTNPCENADCAADETCVSFLRGPCLSTKTRDDHSVECKQYKCVSTKAECSDDTLPREVVCGEDSQTYPSECHLVQKSVAFAYRGPCRLSCMTGNTKVCGTDGVLYQSDCHANLLSRHVDYPGACENPVAKPEVVNMDDGSFQYANRRCRKVHENKRCLYPTCTSTVIPEGSCCPVCGAAVSIRIDKDIASDLLELPLLKPSMDLASLETLHAFIRRIQDPQHLRKCRMTIDYTERNDLSVLFTPRKPGYITFCQKAAQDTMEYINLHSNSSDPIEAMLAAAVAVETGATPISAPTRVKRNVNLYLVRIRRNDHHEHHSVNSTGSSVAPSHGMLFSVGVFTNLYWFIHHFCSNS